MTRRSYVALASLAALGRGSGSDLAAEGCAGLCAAFASIDTDSPESFALTLPAGLALPPGHDGRRYHVQGVQGLPGGGWVVSGSAPTAGYLALADERGVVRRVEILHEDFDHAGGFQIADVQIADVQIADSGGFKGPDPVLAIGSERTGERGGGSHIDFYDVRGGVAAQPRHLPHLTIERETETAGEVALARVGSVHWALVGGWDAECLELFEIAGALRDPESRPESVARWCASRDGVALDSVDRLWPAYQSLNLFADPAGGVVLVGTASSSGTDRADLFEVRLRDGSLALRKLATRSFRTARGVRFAYAAGAFRAAPATLGIAACSRSFDDEDALACQRWR